MKFYFSALILCLVMFLIYLVQIIVPGFTDGFVLDSHLVAGRPYTLITSIFLHGSTTHLLSNLFALGLFGLLLEKVLGTKRFLLVFFSGGFIASLAAAFFYSSSLGASGAIFTILGTLGALRPKMMVWTYGVPMPMFVAVIFWFILDMAGAFYPSNIANLAHIAGLLAGLILGVFLRSSSKKEETEMRRGKNISDQEFKDWEDEFM